jgi:DAK2 domain fusion protein YloV
VLKKAGVVDAGGQGLVVILEGAQRELRQTAERPVADLAPRQSKVDFHLPPELEEIEFPYDIQLLLIGDGLEAEELREQLLPLGDCVLVVGTPQMLKIHIHTDNPAPVMEACVQRGEMRSIEILNMREQQEALLNGAEQAPAPVADNDIGIVAVASGDGLTEVLRSLGAHEIVTGGQTMNPSTKDLLRAVQQVPSQNVIILPNNKNVILAAEQVVGLTDKRVMVVPSRSVPQGIMALMSLRPDLELEAAVQRMTNACSQVQTGEVTYAVRDSHLEDNDIQAGDILGIVNGHIAVVGKDPGDVLQEMVANMVNADTAVITLYYGSDVALAEAQARQEALANSYPDLEVELVRGGQPLYYYIVAVE